jgi:hypothetical protein
MHNAIARHPGVLIAAAQAAWERGAYDRCLAILDVAPPMVGPPATEALLIRGSALIRLRRYSEASAVLTVDPSTLPLADASRVRLLLAKLYANSSRPHDALCLTDEVESALGHRNVSAFEAELAYVRAGAFRIIDESEEAERQAVRAQSIGDGRWSVLAIGIRGYLRIRMTAHAQAYEFFRQALAAYALGTMRDDYWEALMLTHIAGCECQLRSTAIPATYASRSTTRLDFTSSEPMRRVGASIFNMDAWSAALDGNRAAAFRLGRRATLLAPTPLIELKNLVHCALVAKLLGNLDVAADLAGDALTRARRTDWSTNTSQSAIAILLAEYFADVDPATARELLRYYDISLQTISLSDTTLNDHHDEAHRALIGGIIHRTEGQLARAHHAFTRAQAIYEQLGMRWRAALCLLELDTVPVPERKFPFPLDDAARIILADYPHSFLADRLGAWKGVYDDPIASALSPVRLHVLRRLLDGASAKGVAEMLGMSIGNVRNRIAELQAAFDVTSMQALLIAVRNRGIGAPSWSQASAVCSTA